MIKRITILGMLAVIATFVGACRQNEPDAATRLYDRISNERFFAAENADLVSYEVSRLRNYEKAHVDSAGKLIPVANWPAAEQEELAQIKASARMQKLRYNTAASRFNEYFRSQDSPFKQGTTLPAGRTKHLVEFELAALE